ncbi:phytosulfokine receptor 1-like [Hordeum vulgare subsp. vulgare]|uniref:non-specific serine/threonine protein kinase n=1 Tax=Hordeum vulgare subsp. vulgare TaxID=112509 RepID=A0A8I6YP84_HORVV|nr:phytosulfokine receptor 1-like [Hordeum vulgare subsp. vulgare]
MAGRGRGGALAAAAALLLPVIVLLSWCWGGVAQPSPRCGDGDLAALRGFSTGLDAPVDGWPADDNGCCAWPGVVCGGAGVVGVVLPNRTLRGEVAASLAGLTALRVLNLSGNALRGALPPGLLRLRRLEVLDVSSNALAGALVDAAGAGLIELPAVRVFNVSYNSFNGSHPVLPSAVNLTAYDASGNAFEGHVDAAAVCTSSPGLRVLRLSMNRLSGDFPVGFGQCRFLFELSLDGNGITGVLPDDLFAATSLRYLTLHTNSISGEVPVGLRNLTGLVRLDLSFNAFTGALPEVFDALAGTLQELSAPSNVFTGGLPATLSLCVNLRVLNLRNNTLAGAIGLDFGAVNSLVYLDLGVNKFTGPIPASLPECTGMTALNLGRNLLTGEIPPSFATFPSLSFLSLTGNGFSNVTSALRILQRLPNLTSLVLTKNFRGGEAMPEDGIDGFGKIEVLVIANCELTGAIPAWLAGLRKLKVLDISWNRLAGPIPPLLGELDRLFYLDISNNSLQGEIPASLTRMPALLAGSGNGRDDDDEKVQDFPFFMRRNVSAKGRQYNQVSSFPASLVLGRNNLTGGVPAALGALARLHIVDLSWNGFSGPIPPELSGMTSLESLDVSHNALSGAIPASLTRLSFLSHFAVAYNNLSGEIPVGGQFSTFSRVDFAGNPFLCGFHVGRKCDRERDDDDQATDGSTTWSNEGRRSAASAGVVAAICVGTTLLVAVGLAVTWRTWSRRRQEDNACRVAAGDDEESLDSSAARSSTLVLLFPGDEEEGETTTVVTLDEVVKATGDFDESRIVGCGGFGMVYRATLADGRDVAVKRLSGDFHQMEREFRAEVEALSRVRHRNLVALRGYCRVGKDVRLLIYPYMENGSLDHWLHERANAGDALPWPARLRIAMGAARGLAHLHGGGGGARVMHRDVKSSNILLDAAMEARLGDFGLARLARGSDDTHVTTDLVGTLGYIPPEYGHSPAATYRGDVYSMGVVLVELVTGRRPVDMAARLGARDVTAWAARLRREGRGHEAVDAAVSGPHREEAARVLELACACVREDPKARPTAQQLVVRLDAIAGAAATQEVCSDAQHTVDDRSFGVL